MFSKLTAKFSHLQRHDSKQSECQSTRSTKKQHICVVITWLWRSEPCDVTFWPKEMHHIPGRFLIFRYFYFSFCGMILKTCCSLWKVRQSQFLKKILVTLLWFVEITATLKNLDYPYLTFRNNCFRWWLWWWWWLVVYIVAMVMWFEWWGGVPQGASPTPFPVVAKLLNLPDFVTLRKSCFDWLKHTRARRLLPHTYASSCTRGSHITGDSTSVYSCTCQRSCGIPNQHFLHIICVIMLHIKFLLTEINVVYNNY